GCSERQPDAVLVGQRARDGGGREQGADGDDHTVEVWILRHSLLLCAVEVMQPSGGPDGLIELPDLYAQRAGRIVLTEGIERLSEIMLGPARVEVGADLVEVADGRPQLVPDGRTDTLAKSAQVGSEPFSGAQL